MKRLTASLFKQLTGEAKLYSTIARVIYDLSYLEHTREAHLYFIFICEITVAKKILNFFRNLLQFRRVVNIYFFSHT